MTREEILNMQAGKKLDALIEQYVFGNEVRWIRDSYPISGEGEGKYQYIVEDYSTNISAAWEVVEKMPVDMIHPYAGFRLTKLGNSVIVSFDGTEVSDLTAPEAICKAALLAVLEG